MIILVCPGQGSQTPGFLQPWLELPGAHDFLAAASEASGVDLIKHGTDSDQDTIRATEIAQPLIVAAALLTEQALRAEFSAAQTPWPEKSLGVAGHSVGEFAAAAISGVLDTATALRLVAVRGKAMAAAAATQKTGMSAVVGGDAATVLAAISAAGLTPANRNGGGQIVAAGTLEQLATLQANPPRGCRVIPLQVAGAFHTAHMAAAIAPLQQAADTITPADPQMALWSNADGEQVKSGSKFCAALVSQVANPVRWDACMESFRAAGITGLIELAPAGALSGIAKRALREIPAIAIKTPADLAAAAQLIRDAA